MHLGGVESCLEKVRFQVPLEELTASDKLAESRRKFQIVGAAA